MSASPSPSSGRTFEKILRGDGLRKSRFHDEKGNRIHPSLLWRHAGPALITHLSRLVLGYRPALPWICYGGIDFLTNRLGPESRVLEFGSGMSTVWYASRARQVCSVEDYRPWFEKVRGLVKSRGLDNVHYRFAESPEDYTNFMQGDAEGFDLVMIDGSHRSECIRKSAGLLRPGGVLYLDDSDKDTAKGGDMRTAEELLRDLARQKGGVIHEFCDFSPTQFFVKQGIAWELPAG
jgi:SAM-dependent methyltransferase